MNQKEKSPLLEKGDLMRDLAEKRGKEHDACIKARDAFDAAHTLEKTRETNPRRRDLGAEIHGLQFRVPGDMVFAASLFAELCGTYWEAKGKGEEVTASVSKVRSPKENLISRRAGDLLPGDVMSLHPLVGRKARVRSIGQEEHEARTIVFEDAPDLSFSRTETAFFLPRRFAEWDPDGKFGDWRDATSSIEDVVPGRVSRPRMDLAVAKLFERYGLVTHRARDLRPGDVLFCHDDTREEVVIKQTAHNAREVRLEFDGALPMHFFENEEVVVLRDGFNAKVHAKNVKQGYVIRFFYSGTWVKVRGNSMLDSEHVVVHFSIPGTVDPERRYILPNDVLLEVKRESMYDASKDA